MAGIAARTPSMKRRLATAESEADMIVPLSSAGRWVALAGRPDDSVRILQRNGSDARGHVDALVAFDAQRLNEIDLVEPPISTFALPPTPAAAPAVTPP